MSRKVYTYTDLRTLGTTSFWNEIRMFPQITVTSDLHKSLKGTYAFDKVEGLFSNDEDMVSTQFHNLRREAIGKWGEDVSRFPMLVHLSAWGRACSLSDSEQDAHYMDGIRRNYSRMLSSILLLEEMEVWPEDLLNIAGEDRNLQVLARAWEYLILHDETIHTFRARMESLKKKETWIPILTKLFGSVRSDTLVLHGFYYFTPLQERFLSLLETAGFKLVFLFPYDDRYGFANEIWKKTYAPAKGYDPNWIMDAAQGEKDPWGEVFEGRKGCPQNRIRIREYGSVMEFVREVNRSKMQGYFLYSSDHHTANDILRDFYPDQFGERRLLSYPIGQFLVLLNKLWDIERQTVTLDRDRLMECFSCGWLAVDGISGKQFQQDLQYILPFFRDCTAASEWKERMTLLEEIYGQVIEPFRRDDNRWAQLMGNPFLNFGVFALEPGRMEILLKLIRRLIGMAEDLFEVSGPIHVWEHLKKLDRILRSNERSDDLYPEERELMGELFHKLEDTAIQNTSCYPEDISAAMNVLMNGKLEDGEIKANHIGMVSPLEQIDAAIVKQNGRVHICMCDSDRLPGGRKPYGWPLTKQALERLCEWMKQRKKTDEAARTGRSYVENLLHMTEYAGVCNRYFLYSALKNPDVILSFVSSMNGKSQAPSPYIRLICQAADISIASAGNQAVTWNSVSQMPYSTGRVKPYDLKQMPDHTPMEARMDYAICPMKYALGYVVEKAPAFENEFHMNYAISALVRSIYGLMEEKGYSFDDVYHRVMALFPAMRRIEKRQIYDYLMVDLERETKEAPGGAGAVKATAPGSSQVSAELRDRIEYRDAFYTNARLLTHFPNQNVREQAEDASLLLGTRDGKQGMDFYKTAADTATPANRKRKVDVCLFCQHQSFCRYAVYSSDTEGLYD